VAYAALEDADEAVAAPKVGRPFALMYIPRLRDSVWDMPVVEGVGLDELAKGIGQDPGTAMPGQIGGGAVVGDCGFGPGGEPVQGGWPRGEEVGHEVVLSFARWACLRSRPAAFWSGSVVSASRRFLLACSMCSSLYQVSR